MDYGLGVDLGTTSTAAAIGRPGRIEMVGLGGRDLLTPSVAFAASDSSLLTGDAADRQARRDPGRAAWEFKRRLGDPTPLLLGGAPFSPVRLLAAVLADTVAAATARIGHPPARIVLSRPAVWGQYRLEQFDEVPRLAGLDAVRMVTEPEAVAIYYALGEDNVAAAADALVGADALAGAGAGAGGAAVGGLAGTAGAGYAAGPAGAGRQQLADGSVIAVYDLGGGTFDSAVLHYEDGRARVLGTPEGVEWLGGADFDEAVFQYVDRALDGAVSALGPVAGSLGDIAASGPLGGSASTAADPVAREDAAALARLRSDCILAKEALSFDAEAVIPVFLRTVRRDVEITRAQFEELIRPALSSTVEALHRALRSADVEPADLTAVLLSGGSSRIPLVARMVEESLGRPVIVDAHPQRTVALGAALLAAGPAPAPEMAPRPTISVRARTTAVSSPPTDAPRPARPTDGREAPAPAGSGSSPSRENPRPSATAGAQASAAAPAVAEPALGGAAASKPAAAGQAGVSAAVPGNAGDPGKGEASPDPADPGDPGDPGDPAEPAEPGDPGEPGDAAAGAGPAAGGNSGMPAAAQPLGRRLVLAVVGLLLAVVAGAVYGYTHRDTASSLPAPVVETPGAGVPQARALPPTASRTSSGLSLLPSRI